MSVIRDAILAASQSSRLKEQAQRYGFVRRSVRRFLPGERVEDALEAAKKLASDGIATLITQLGENVTERAEAENVTKEYLDLLQRIETANLPTEISVKLTQLGLDLDREFCFENLSRLVTRAPANKTVWVDMEHSPYVDATLKIYHRARKLQANVGVCVQAYLYRTSQDIEKLIAEGASVRLVKGAYNEPSEIAFPKKNDVDENYFHLAQQLLTAQQHRAIARAVIATHDTALIARIRNFCQSQGIANSETEFAMLYGIQRSEQLQLAREGYRSVVLVSYGTYWYPWFMRRLAERPANLVFLLRNFFTR